MHINVIAIVKFHSMAGKVPYFYLTVKSKLNLKEKIFSSLLGGSFGFLIGFSAVGAAAFTDFEEI